ncbi:MAG: DUF4421 family protein [Bacteroidaceae bacterium]|nr:DUF4421 family protein [Bacteroidaceae bacterium]
MGKTVFFILMLMLGNVAFAQSKREALRGRVDSMLQANYTKGTYDTLYIKRPESKLMLKLKGNLSGNSIHAKNTVDENNVLTKLNTDTRATLSAGVNYLGLSAGLAINPGRLSGKNKDFEINLNGYANRFGVEASYQLSKTLSGDVDYNADKYHLDKGFLRLASVSVTGYYAFNYRRFSYPAAFTQSYIQKRSAGSWLLGFSYQGASIKTTDDAPSEMGDIRIYVGNFAIGGGYGYNFVAKKWLFHLSTQPNVIIFNSNSFKMNGEKRSEALHFPEMIVNSRAAVVYNINPKYFAGSTFLVNSTLFGNLNHYTRQVKWYGRLFVGYRL